MWCSARWSKRCIRCGDLLLNTGVTLYRALAGFLIAGVVGVLLGMAMVRIAYLPITRFKIATCSL
jgi:ABC-type nitrate/sulfonate/bicarbonate transport system permease component